MQRTSSSGVISATSRHTGLPTDLAHRSPHRVDHRAGRQVNGPLSGPIQRSWLSLVKRRQKAPMSAAISSSRSPTI